jgi:molecular chaperone GrpE (heat shock protein)
MNNQPGPKLPKWPFFLGNVVLLGLACFIFSQSSSPMSRSQMVLFLLAGVLGALLAVLPFLFEYWAAVKLVETSGLVSTVEQIRHLELLAVQISAATAQWQLVQEYSASTVTAAREISDKMVTEAAAFTEFLQKTNDGEKSSLRLEVEKLRRVEAEWLQVIVRLLDHTYALFKAAERSGQPGLIEQMGNFQNSCRDVARRIGLVPFAPKVNEPFDSDRHQPSESQAAPAAGARVLEAVATGYTYQGRLLRPALVALENPRSAEGMEQLAAPAVEGKEAKKVLAEESLL